jgi:hypothetical protein
VQNTLTPWSRAHLEEWIFVQLIKKFSMFYGTQRFITVFTIPAKKFCPEADEFIPHPHILFLLKSILILSSYLHLSLPNVFFPSGIAIKATGGMKPTIRLYLVPKVRMRGAVPPRLNPPTHKG